MQDLCETAPRVKAQAKAAEAAANQSQTLSRGATTPRGGGRGAAGKFKGGGGGGGGRGAGALANHSGAGSQLRELHLGWNSLRDRGGLQIALHLSATLATTAYRYYQPTLPPSQSFYYHELR